MGGMVTSTVKHVFLLLNFILACLALFVVGFGIFILVSNAENVVDHGENAAGGLVTAVGVIILIVSVFGCLAAIHESNNRLIIYLVSIMVLILLQLLMVGTASQGTQDGLSGSVREGFEMLWQSELKEPGSLAFYENWLHCCGVNNTDDYSRIQHDIPKSCCIEKNCAQPENIYKDGCQDKFEEYLAGKFLTFCILTWLLILCEIVAAVFAWLLLTGLKHQRRRQNVGWM